MEKMHNQLVNETVYHETLANGLSVTVIPKAGFNKTYAIFTTNYGSIDNEFVPLNGDDFIRVPDGIAHFLEHKLFEKEDGDVFQLFGQQGASANAFTSFTRTSYLFSSTEKVGLNLTTLLDFVQDPYFTPETVEKEKGIISQEIQMYQDDANWRQFFGVIGNLYPGHPLSIDIAGTVDSIMAITAEDLHTCYETFYHPSNMNLVVVGNVDVEETLKLVRLNQGEKTFVPPQVVRRKFPETPFSEIIPKGQITMPVSRPKVSVGVKIANRQSDDVRENMRYQLKGTLLCQMLLGDTSSHRQSLYDEGLIDDGFGFEFSADREWSFADFGGDSLKPEELAASLKAILLNVVQDPNMTEAHLELLKRKFTGKFFQSLNSLEYIANKFSQQAYGETTVFDTSDVLSEITLQELQELGQEIFQLEAMTEFYIYPEVSSE